MLDFSSLSPTQFEEFCFDLLVSLGALNVSWRKGSNQTGSPADQGRDIQCVWEIDELGGGRHRETWFVECKHHKEAVSPDKLQSAFSWADAEKPNVLLIASSGFLSNPSKNYIETRLRNSSSPYRIKMWENKDLERLASRYPSILRRHQMKWDVQFFEFMHPVHIEYLRKPPINTLEYLLRILGDCDVAFRDATFGMAFFAIINPRAREPEDLDHQTLGDLLEDPVNYFEFKKKCRKLADFMYEGFLVKAIVLQTLQGVFIGADPTSIEEQRQSFQRMIDVAKNPALMVDFEGESDRVVKLFTAMLQTVGDNLDQNVERYFDLCEKVIARLFEEPPPQIPEHVRDQVRRLREKELREENKGGPAPS